MALIGETFDFLSRLTENNNRDWFKDHKAEFDYLRAEFRNGVQKIIEKMSLEDDTLRGVDANDCIYRIYRDIRFREDKTPYKTHFAAVIARGGRKSNLSCYYLHIEPQKSEIGGGVWCPDPVMLKALRHSIDDNIEEFEDIISNEELKKNYNLVGDSLKLMPKGFSKDSPNGKYIKMKEFLLEKMCSNDYFDAPDWTDKVAKALLLQKPFHDFMNYTIEEL